MYEHDSEDFLTWILQKVEASLLEQIGSKPIIDLQSLPLRSQLQEFSRLMIRGFTHPEAVPVEFIADSDILMFFEVVEHHGKLCQWKKDSKFISTLGWEPEKGEYYLAT